MISDQPENSDTLRKSSRCSKRKTGLRRSKRAIERRIFSDTESFSVEAMHTQYDQMKDRKLMAVDSRQNLNEILVTNIDKLTTKDSLVTSFYQNKPKISIENFIEQNFEGGLSDFLDCV